MNLIDFILNIDVHLGQLIEEFGIITYLIIFLIVFCETGLVVTPFLPGDSLLFAAGAFAAKGNLSVGVLLLILWIASILGDTVNYHIGKYLGPKVFERNYRFIKQDYLEHTKTFYAKYGNKTIVMSRFLPILRTFAPFVAGVGSMNYVKFMSYNVIGGLLWVLTFVLGGYFFGNIPWVQENFSLVILGIILASLVLAAAEFLRHKHHAAKTQ